LVGSAVTLDLSNVDSYLIKTDNLGNKLWSKNFDFDNTFDVVLALDTTSDGGYIFTGFSFPESSGHAWIIKTDEYGMEISEDNYELGITN